MHLIIHFFVMYITMSIFRFYILNFKVQRTGHILLRAGFGVPVKDSPQSTSGEQMPPIPILVHLLSTLIFRKRFRSQAVTDIGFFRFDIFDNEEFQVLSSNHGNSNYSHR